MKKKIFDLTIDLEKIPSYESRFNNLGLKLFEATNIREGEYQTPFSSDTTQKEQFPSLMPEKTLPSRFLRRKGHL